MQQFITTNMLFYGDNLAIMREYIPDESIDRPRLPTANCDDIDPYACTPQTSVPW